MQHILNAPWEVHSCIVPMLLFLALLNIGLLAVALWRVHWLDRQRRSDCQMLRDLNQRLEAANEQMCASQQQLQEVNQQLQTQAQVLQEGETMLRRSQKVAALGHYIYDVKTGAWTSSETMDEVFGITLAYRKDVPGWLALVHPDDRAMMGTYLQDQVLGQKKPFDKLYRILRPNDQAVRWVHGTGTLDLDAAGAPTRMFGTIQDITEKKQMQEEIQKIQKMESLGLLAGGIAHDFNNLLGGVYGYLDLARMRAQQDPEFAEYLSCALASYQRARDLTQQLLTFAKGGRPAYRPVRIVPLVCNAANLSLSGSSAKPSLEASNELVMADVDAGQISQVISNLVLNARQAMPRGGTVAISVNEVQLKPADVAGLPAGSYVEIRVCDSGAGIQPGHLPHIFEPFFTTKQTGNGLGLAMAYSIIQKHNGHILVESTLGQGSTFRVFLPVSNSQEELALPKPQLMRGSGRVLILDNEQIILKLVIVMLGQLGYTVETAIHGEEAIAKYAAAREAGTPFRAVILDLTIPNGMGGLETVAILRKMDPAVKAMVSSGYARDAAILSPAKFGFAAAIVKPYLQSELSQVLHMMLSENKST
ncbi:MAG: ATP-binding protein [Kiritimatiellia bacterium]